MDGLFYQTTFVWNNFPVSNYKLKLKGFVFNDETQQATEEV